MHPMLNIAVRARAAPARSSIARRWRAVGSRCGRSRGTTSSPRSTTPRKRRLSRRYARPILTTRCSLRNRAPPRDKPSISGSSIRSTAPPTSFTASRSTASPSIRHRGALAHGDLRPNQERATASKAAAHSSMIAASACRSAHASARARRHRISVPRGGTHRALHAPAQDHDADGSPCAAPAQRPSTWPTSPAAGSTRSGRWAFRLGHGRGRALAILEAGGLVGDRSATRDISTRARLRARRRRSFQRSWKQCARRGVMSTGMGSDFYTRLLWRWQAIRLTIARYPTNRKAKYFEAFT